MGNAHMADERARRDLGKMGAAMISLVQEKKLQMLHEEITFEQIPEALEGPSCYWENCSQGSVSK